VKARVARAAWLLLGYTVLVIVWGAYVRATGAGAGCGSHWPLCNGQVIPRSPRLDTLVEFAHRLSSGLLGLFVLALAVAVFRAFPKGHGARKGVLWVSFFVVTEALLGAGLVRFEWVVANDSEARVYVMGFHLVNTFLLLGALTLTAWHAQWEPIRKPLTSRSIPLGIVGVALLAVGSSGAITALGDTLVLTAGLSPADSPVVARLVATRFYHPTVAVVTFVLLVVVLWRLGRAFSRPFARALVALFVVQLALGALNVYLRAPVWMQLLHLLVSDGIWIAFVLFTATTLTPGKEKMV
jgi:cytochrome c oxidase assembly protein subunit 15